jgi:hypothetical protein
MLVARSLRRIARIAALAAVALSLASCATVGGIVRTQRALVGAGFAEASVNLNADTNGTILRVGYRTKATDVAALSEEYAAAARVVWLKAPLRFDAVQVHANDAPGSCIGDCVDRFDRTELAAANGPRDPKLDKDIQNELLGTGAIVLGVIAVAAILLVWLLMRSRRRARLVPPWGYQPGPGAGWPVGSALPPPGWSPGARVPPPTSATPHEPAPGFAPPPPGYVAPPQVPAPPATPAAWSSDAAPPTPFAPPEPPQPPPMPSHDIWERPPS